MSQPERVHAADFVGRTRELAQLDSILEEAAAGRGRVVLIGGEPGIGKSRLTDEGARRSGAAGFRALWGRCWEAGGAPPYWPWIQAVRGLVREIEPGELRKWLGSGAPDLAQIIPEVRERLADVPEPPALDPDSARFRLFQAMSEFLRRASEREPLVLVLEDLQSADIPSLLLLRFAAQELSDARIALLATYRTTDLIPDHPLAEAVAELGRMPSSHLLLLGGLPDSDVADLISATAGLDPPERLVAAITRETEGNPLFAVEIVRLLAAENRLRDPDPASALVAIPQGVREVIGRRLLRLSDECTRVLTAAAVLGRDFPLEPLRRLTEHSMEELLETLEEASTARVIAEIHGAPGWMRFTHALIREALYEDLSATQRLRLHRSAGAVLEEVYAHALDDHLPELAHHHVMAAPAGDPSRAVEYSHRAAERALDQLAYEEAVRLLRGALGALDLTASPDQEIRCDLLVALGDAEGRAGDRATSRETFVAAADLAERLGRADALAMAALGYGGRFTWGRAADDRRLIPMLESARDALGEADDPMRVRVLARLACALRDRPEREPRWSLSEEALDVARRLEDPASLAYALTARWASTWEPSTSEDRLPLAQEAVRVAQQGDDKERAQESRLGLFGTLLELGRLPEARAELEAMERLAKDIRQPSHTWMSHASRTLLNILEGRFDEAEAFIREMFELGREAIQEAYWHLPMHLFLIRRERGDLAEVEPLVRHAAETFTWFPVFRCARVSMDLQLGRRREAASELERLSADRFAALPLDNEWLLGMGYLAEVIEPLGAADEAEVAYELLAPYAHLNAVGLAEGCLGALARPLGLLSITLGRLDAAEEHLRAAVAMNEEMGARPWTAHSLHDLGRVLLRRDAPGDRDEAVNLLRRASATARDLGMSVLADRVAAILGPSVEAAPVPAAPAEGGRRPATLRREGEYWSVAFDGAAFRLKDSKGLRYLSRLLAEPGREFHALDLLTASSGETGLAPRQDGLGMDSGEGAGPPLDARAKAAYRARLEDLDAAIEEAEASGDAERASRARDERAAIGAELGAAVGLGGRDRPGASAAERARLNVTRALRSALARIAEHNPPLGTHLDRSLRTGTFCVYLPDPASGISWGL